MYEDVFSSSANIGQQVSHPFFLPAHYPKVFVSGITNYLSFHITSAWSRDR